MTFTLRHADAKRLLIGGAIAMILAPTANYMLGGSGGLIWMVLLALGFVAVVVAMIYFISHPIRRRT